MTQILRLDALAGLTGRGVRVAIIDSGVHAAHPHVQGIAGGLAFDDFGDAHPDYVDRLGHGTAVTAVIREKAPAAEVWALKVFDAQLATTTAALVAALEWAVHQRVHLVNLSLGTPSRDHAPALARAVADALQAGVTIVAAGPTPQTSWLPGSFPGVLAVSVDWTMPRDHCALDSSRAEHPRAAASGYPRPIPGVPPERNLRGLSFAVANVSGLMARALERSDGALAPLLADLASRSDEREVG